MCHLAAQEDEEAEGRGGPVMMAPPPPSATPIGLCILYPLKTQTYTHAAFVDGL